MKILFWITNFPDSVGEITHAYIFAKQLISSGIEIYFLVDDNEDFFIKENFKIINSKKILEIYKYNFDIIIFSEYFQLFFKINSHEYSNIRNVLYNYIIPTKIPLLTFDTLNLGTDLNNFKKQVKNIPGWEKIVKYIDFNIPIIPILPCPPNEPSIHNNKQYWCLSNVRIDNELKKVLKYKLKCSQETKIIFMTISLWEYDRLKKSGKVFYFLLLEKLLIHYLQKLDKDICLLIISPIPFLKSARFNKVKLHHIYINKTNKVDYEEFQNIFSSSDLILTNNTIQSTFIRSLYAGIPGIDIKSSISIENIHQYKLSKFVKETAEILELIQEHTIDSINTIFHRDKFPFYNSSFSKLFKSIEIFDENNFIKSVYNFLYDEDTKKEFKNNHNIYLNSLKGSYSAIEIISNLI